MLFRRMKEFRRMRTRHGKAAMMFSDMYRVLCIIAICSLMLFQNVNCVLRTKGAG
jgi:hypothetical protein